MKNIITKIVFIFIILIMLFSISEKVYAWSGIVSDGKGFIGAADSSKIETIKEDKLKSLSGYLYNILLSAGVVVAVIVATALGIQFMIGGAEDQAKVKEMLVPFIVGCVIVFGGFGLWKIAILVGQKIEDTATLNPNQYIEIASTIEKLD